MKGFSVEALRNWWAAVLRKPLTTNGKSWRAELKERQNMLWEEKRDTREKASSMMNIWKVNEKGKKLSKK